MLGKSSPEGKGKNALRPGLLEREGFVDSLASVFAIIVGLAFGFLILLFSNPGQAAPAMGYILRGGFSGGLKGVGQVLYFATPIIMTGLSVPASLISARRASLSWALTPPSTSACAGPFCRAPASGSLP